MTSPVQVEHRPGLVRLVLDRPSSGNALDIGLVRALTIELERAEADPGIRVLTLTGRDRFFCAGGDVAMISSVPAQDRYEALLELATGTARLIAALARTRLLVIAGINGITAGAGLGLLLAADWVLVADDARIVGAFANVGLTPDTGVSFLLPRTVGHQRAVELALGGRRLIGQEAVGWGLAAATAPTDDFNRQLGEAEERFLATPGHVLAPTTGLLRASRFGPGWEEHLRTEAQRVAEMAATAESIRLVEDFVGRLSQSPPAG